MKHFRLFLHHGNFLRNFKRVQWTSLTRFRFIGIWLQGRRVGARTRTLILFRFTTGADFAEAATQTKDLPRHHVENEFEAEEDTKDEKVKDEMPIVIILQDG